MAVERVALRVHPDIFKDRRFIIDGFRQSVRRAIRKGTELLEREIRRGAPMDTGKLRKSIRVKNLERPELEGADVVMLRYGFFQEVGFGGKGKFPPPGALAGWVRRKLGIRDPKEVKRVAFLVARKIATKGVKAKLFVLSAIRENQVRVRDFFREELQRAKLGKK